MSSKRIPLDAVQSAVYGVLNTKLATLSPAIPVYSYKAPQDAAYPFCVITGVTATPEDTKGSAAQSVQATIQVVSNSPSATQINAALNAALEACSAGTLTLTGTTFRDVGLGRQDMAELNAVFDGEEVLLMGVLKYAWLIDDGSFS